MKLLLTLFLAALVCDPVPCSKFGLFSNNPVRPQRDQPLSEIPDASELPEIPDFADIDNIGNEPIDITMTSHHPCKRRSSKHETIRFSNHTVSPLIPNTDQPGCFIMRGPVQIFEAINPDVEIYVEMKVNPRKTARPLKCEQTLDGDQIGSCLYEQPCDLEAKHQEQVATSKVKVTRANGEPLKCDETLEAGEYDDIELHFCPPTRMQLAQLSETELLKTIERKAGQSKLATGDVTLFLRIYVFERQLKLNQLRAREPAMEVNMRRWYNVTDPAAASTYQIWSKLPFEKFILTTQSYLSCHVMVGKVKLIDDVQ